jgi:tripartite-type tricarboxylate transporter receptor subunit TctC
MRKILKLRAFFIVCCSLILFVSVSDLSAQDFPVKPIRFIVPFSPGGGTDTLTRILAEPLTERFGQQVIVENRPGAGGTIGTALVAKAEPDGHTLGMIISSHAINPSLYSKLPYDSVKDFSPVIFINVAPRWLVVHTSVPAKSLKELIALAKDKPGELNYGSGGNGTSGHLAGELLKSMAGIDIVHVPYKGGGPLLLDLIAGRIQMTFGSPSTVLPQIEAGKLRGIAVTSTERSELTPDLPTMEEAGLPGYVATEWNGVVVPAGTPQSIILKINAELNYVLKLPDVKEKLTSKGLKIIGGPPEKFEAHLKAEMAKFAKIIKEANIRIE